MKPIETVYGGYRFRSRLEARWAVFFDTLRIEYRYEPEGYDLGGIWYLPDFWLPELDCWIEIKGEEPTREEKEKAQLLAWHTQKSVHILAGDVWKDIKVVSYLKISIFAEEKPRSPDIGMEVHLPPELSILIAKIDMLDIYLALDPAKEEVRVMSNRDKTLFPMHLSWYLEDARREIEGLETRIRELPDLMSQIEQRKKELFALTTAVCSLPAPFYLVAYGHTEVFFYHWMVCQKCKRAHLCNEFLEHRRCSCPLEVVVDEDGREWDVCRSDQELLLAAYTAARQARFDGKGAMRTSPYPLLPVKDRRPLRRRNLLPDALGETARRETRPEELE